MMQLKNKIVFGTKYIGLFLGALLLISVGAQAQRTKKKATPKTEKKQPPAKPAPKETLLPDDQKDRTVTITSSFTPSLRESSKINFSGTAAMPATSLPSLRYDVPAQNLFFPYIPGSLRPLALNPENPDVWKNDGFIKLGYGNYSTPYLEGGIALGDGVNSSYAVHVKHTSSTGKLPLQRFGQTAADFSAIYSAGNNEISGKAFFDNTAVRAYGIRAADSLLLNHDSAHLHYTTYGVKIGLRNKEENEYGISYNPSLAVNLFSDNWQAHESNLVLDAPLSKSIADNLFFDLGFTADITNYKHNDTSINNNIYYVRPAISYRTDNFLFKGGFTPSWSKSDFKLLPDLELEAKLPDVRFVLQAGYKGYYEKNTYRSLVSYNPWIMQPTDLQNTRAMEFYGGLKGSAGSHFTYNARLSYITFYGHPLFVNDSVLGNRFYTPFEPKMKDLRIHGELGYKLAETFSLLGGVSINQYSNLDSNYKAWGLPPVELNGSLRWQVHKDIWLKSDLYFWNGAWGRNEMQDAVKLKAVADWNAGMEFKVWNNWNLWFQVNNILNNKYQRWNQYESLGLNVVGGIIYNFDLSK